VPSLHVRIHLAGISGDAGAEPEGLYGVRSGYGNGEPLPRGGTSPTFHLAPSPEKKRIIFRLKWHVLILFWAVFLKMLRDNLH